MHHVRANQLLESSRRYAGGKTGSQIEHRYHDRERFPAGSVGRPFSTADDAAAPVVRLPLRGPAWMRYPYIVGSYRAGSD